MFSFSFNIACLLFLTLISIFYFSKNKIDNIENEVYKKLIATSFAGLSIDILGYVFMAIYNVQGIINLLISKLYLVYFLVWIIVFKDYICAVCVKSRNKYKKGIIFSYVVLILFILLDIILPLEIIADGEKMYSTGLIVIFLYMLVALYIIYMLIMLIKYRKKMQFKEKLPLLSFLGLGIAVMIIQFINPEILLITGTECFITCLMYFTIENPDMKMIEQLNIAKDEADKANRAKTDFLSSMSHEIRTPLNAIVGFSECINQAETLEEAKENAEDIVGASKTLLEIVNSILDISKIEAGKIEIHNASYNSYELFGEIERLIRARLGDKELEFRISLAPDIPPVLYGDHFNIRKVIINLLTNALKYTDTGYFTFDVKCVNKDGICRLMVNVEDSGRGIKKEDLDKLFTKFQRLDEDRNTTIEGTGLGLAITKQLVELMGGKILVQSTYGKGSKFTVILDQQISNETLNNESPVTVEDIDLSNKRVLVVDDNKLNIKVASKILSRYKLKIDSAESGMECLDKVNAGERYDIILMDDMMPRMKGGETLLRLKKIEGFNTPVIALTANAINGMEQKYLDQGFNDYLSKPIEKDKLHLVLTKYLVDNKEESISEETVHYNDYSDKNVLIVDDNKLNIKVAARVMAPYGFKIDEVLSGEECLEAVKNKKYDLIFMDYMMPNMDGIETFNHLHEIEGFDTPVIALTADAVVGARDKFINAGFAEYVSKPIDKAMLNEAIEKVLN